MTVGTILIYGGGFLLGYFLTKFAFAFGRAYRAAKKDLKWARIRIEYASGVVNYKTIPYLDELMLSQLLTIAATKMNWREENDGALKKIVPDQVKAVTVVHNNWPRPTDGVAGGE
jgi:hypothetical protein